VTELSKFGSSEEIKPPNEKPTSTSSLEKSNAPPSPTKRPNQSSLDAVNRERELELAAKGSPSKSKPNKEATGPGYFQLQNKGKTKDHFNVTTNTRLSSTSSVSQDDLDSIGSINRNRDYTGDGGDDVMMDATDDSTNKTNGGEDKNKKLKDEIVPVR